MALMNTPALLEAVRVTKEFATRSRPKPGGLSPLDDPAQAATAPEASPTGSANEEGPHLHFEVKRMRAGESWHQGQEVNPYPLLAGKAAAR